MIRTIRSSARDREELESLSTNPSELVDDNFDYSSVVVNKPWGYEHLAFKNDNVAVWVLHIKQDFQTSLHCHPSKKTSLIVLKGTVICSTLGGDIELNAGEGLFLEKGVFHSTRAVSPDEVIIMETETPVNKKDLVRLGDKYGRRDKGYEGKDFHAPTGVGPYVHIQSFGNGNEDFSQTIGDCSISIQKWKGSQGLLELCKHADNHIVCILSGEIKDEKAGLSLSHGDVFVSHILREDVTDPILEEVEVLTVRKDLPL